MLYYCCIQKCIRGGLYGNNFCIASLLLTDLHCFLFARIFWLITIAEYLAIYASTLLFAFLEDMHYWKKIILELEDTGETSHRVLIVDTLCTFCSTVLFAYLLMIQSTTSEVFGEYSPTTGASISWKLNMLIAWLACSFISIKLVLDHSCKVWKAKINKRKTKHEESKKKYFRRKHRTYIRKK